MAERSYVNEQARDKTGALLVPLDEIRTFDNITTQVVSGVSSVIYSIVSGKTAYIKQVMATELSGHDGHFQLKDTLGSGLTPLVSLIENATTVLDTCIGPITSGVTVEGHTAGDNRAGAEVTLIVQIDPKTTE